MLYHRACPGRLSYLLETARQFRLAALRHPGRIVSADVIFCGSTSTPMP